MAQVVKIMEMKKATLGGKDAKHMALVVIGTCKSMGVTVEGKDPKEIQAEVKKGKYDKMFK